MSHKSTKLDTSFFYKRGSYFYNIQEAVWQRGISADDISNSNILTSATLDTVIARDLPLILAKQTLTLLTSQYVTNFQHQSSYTFAAAKTTKTVMITDIS